MIRTFIQKVRKEIEVIQWTGENHEAVEKFLNGCGYVKGRYVEIGALTGKGYPTIKCAPIGRFIAKMDTSTFDIFTEAELNIHYEIK